MHVGYTGTPINSRSKLAFGVAPGPVSAGLAATLERELQAHGLSDQQVYVHAGMRDAFVVPDPAQIEPEAVARTVRTILTKLWGANLTEKPVDPADTTVQATFAQGAGDRALTVTVFKTNKMAFAATV